MNRIKRLNRFIDDYSRLNPYLKDLLKDVHLMYQQELIKEYKRISRHPYPNEYLSEAELPAAFQGGQFVKYGGNLTNERIFYTPRFCALTALRHLNCG